LLHAGHFVLDVSNLSVSFVLCAPDGMNMVAYGAITVASHDGIIHVTC
jgi:hypothetical protein